MRERDEGAAAESAQARGLDMQRGSAAGDFECNGLDFVNHRVKLKLQARLDGRLFHRAKWRSSECTD